MRLFIENSSGASIEYTFTGTGIALYGGKHSADNMGSFTWKIDDGEANTVNTKKDSGNIEIVELFSDQNLTEWRAYRNDYRRVRKTVFGPSGLSQVWQQAKTLDRRNLPQNRKPIRKRRTIGAG